MKAGQNHTLTVTRISDYGLYLADQEGQEVLLPNRYVSLADKVGDAGRRLRLSRLRRPARGHARNARWPAPARPHS